MHSNVYRQLYVLIREANYLQDKIQHERSAYIAEMKARLQTMDAEMQRLESELARETKPSIFRPL